MGTHWLGEDFLSPLPQRVHGQRPSVPCQPDFHVGIPFGGALYRPRIHDPLTAEEYAALLKRLEVPKSSSGA